MNTNPSHDREHLWLPGGLMWRVLAAVALAAMFAVLMGADETERGDSPYTPTKGEWLCLNLNLGETFAETFRSAVVVRYAYDPAKPDTIEIRVSYAPHLLSPEAVRLAIARAKNNARQAAERKGWDSWLKIEVNVVHET